MRLLSFSWSVEALSSYKKQTDENHLYLLPKQELEHQITHLDALIWTQSGAHADQRWVCKLLKQKAAGLQREQVLVSRFEQ